MGMFGGKQKPAKYSQPRAITSAAAPLRLRDRSELEKVRHRNAVSHSWQLETWRVYSVLGEVGYAFDLIADALARVRVNAAVVVNPDEPPTEVTDGAGVKLVDGSTLGASGGVNPTLAAKARDYVQALNTGDGISSLLRMYAMNKLVAGECYLCLIDGKWSIKSTFEIVVDGANGLRWHPSSASDTASPKKVPAGSTVIRMWTKHPQYSADPDCALKRLLFLCEQLIRLNRMINNSVQSRMNAGILVASDTLKEAGRTPGAEDNLGDGPENPEMSPFEAELHAVLTQPILDDLSGAAVVPAVAFVPKDEVQTALHHISLQRDVDEHLIAYADNVLKRILNGLPIPKDIITGFSQTRYSNAQHIAEEFYKQAVEPLALAFVDDLTVTYLRPLLEAQAVVDGWDAEEVAKLVIWYDASEITTRPDRGADADAGWDRDALSNDAWRREHGFRSDDAPSDEEILQRTLLKQVLPPNLLDYLPREMWPQYFKDAPPLVTKTQAGMSEDAAATNPITHENSGRSQAAPAGSQDQTPPAGGSLPPKAS